MLEPAGVELCDACAVSAGQEVLDVAAGDGNFALAAAREGASVVASDLAPGMLELGRARSEAEGYGIEWVEADAEELPFEDARFDCVGSAFGAVMAPRPEVVARELFRVVMPGGTVGMVSWTPSSYPAERFAIGRKYVPPPPELTLPEEWGDDEVVTARFEGLAGSLTFRTASMPWVAASPEELGERMERSAPAQVAAREALSPEEHEAMQRELLEQARSWNVADDGSFRVDAEYLITVARRRG